MTLYLRSPMRAAIFIIFLITLQFSFGQHALQIVSVDKPHDFFQKAFGYRALHKNERQARKEVADLLHVLQTNGYAAASIDSTISDSAKTHSHVYVGERFESLLLRNGNLDEEMLSVSGAKSAIASEHPVSMPALEAVRAQLLRACETNGYPFAEVRFDSFAVKESMGSVKVFLTRHELFRFDSLSIEGGTKVKRQFLRNYLGIKPGKPYNEARVRSISRRLRELQFAELLREPEVEFRMERARVRLFLKDKRASQFNLLIGLMPGSAGKKLLVTGEARVHLFSPFGVGEELYLEWKSLQPKTQQLDVRISYPYLLGLPLGISGRFELYKRDTSWLDLKGDYGVQYQFIGSNYLKASIRNRTAIVLNVDTNYIKQMKRLPSQLDVSVNEFAVEYFFQQLDYLFNPTNGIVLRVSTSVGEKRIRKNNTILALTDAGYEKGFGKLYDTAQMSALQFSAALSVEKYWRITKRQTVKTSLEAKYFFSRQVFDNEKYRLGGVNSLRGFDDQSILTPYHAISNVEYRYLLSRNAYFYAFFNAAMIEDNSPVKQLFRFPFGFGAGAAFETKVGIFGISYAMGTEANRKLTMRDAKIHFGYINLF